MAKVMKNPDSEFVKNLKKRIKANNGYCPCQIEKTAETKCPCLEFRTSGYCCCGLYIVDPTSTEEDDE